jgi:release factor glutamine methyltransferase
MTFSRDFPHSFQEALRVSRQILSANHEIVKKNLIDVESEIIVMGAHRAATGELLKRSELQMRVADRIPEASAERVLLFSHQRAEGKLLQHLLGYCYFLNHEYRVSPAVLVPRPETEVLVSEVLKILRPLKPSLGFEIGLGSGIISVELLSELSDLKMVSSEISEGAREIASFNASHILKLDVARLEIVMSESPLEVLEPILRKQAGEQASELGRRKADFIISNPPYLDPARTEEFDAEVLQHEPHDALFPKADSSGKVDLLHFYRKIAADAEKVLKTGGHVFLEIASERAQATRELFSEDRWSLAMIHDLTGKDRVLIAQLKYPAKYPVK